MHIIGAGPIGTYTAWQFAKKKEDVTLVEEHKTIGTPVQCTGILTKECEHYLPTSLLNKVTVAKVTTSVIHSQHRQLEVPIGKDRVIDNAAYCQALADKAQKSGAQVLTKHRYVRNNFTEIILKDLLTGKESKEESTRLIGADGPQSSVAKHNNLFSKRSSLIGIQAVVRVKDYDDRIHFHPHIGAYAWYCPAGDGLARIGIAAYRDAKNVFDNFIKKYPGKITCMQGGTIPLYKPRTRVEKMEKNMRIQLIGDAVPFIKNTTGGGIVPGTKAASILVKHPGKYSQHLGQVKKELYVHHTLHKMMMRFTDKDWDQLLTEVSTPHVKKILATTSRDNALRLSSELLLGQPSLVKWMKKMF